MLALDVQYCVVKLASGFRSMQVSKSPQNLGDDLNSRVGHRWPILLNQIAICRGEIDTNLGIFVDVKYWPIPPQIDLKINTVIAI